MEWEDQHRGWNFELFELFLDRNPLVWVLMGSPGGRGGELFSPRHMSPCLRGGEADSPK